MSAQLVAVPALTETSPLEALAEAIRPAFAVDRYMPQTDDPVLWGPACACLLYTSPSPRDRTRSRMPSSA